MQTAKNALILLLVAAVVASPAVASRDLSAATGRELLQSSTDCGRNIPNCKACRYQKFGTTTLTVCVQCNTGYNPKNGGRACWCAPGYKKVGSACVPCNEGNAPNTYAFCSGSKATWDSATATACGANKLTSTSTAKSEKECVAAPGYGWVAGNGAAAAQCELGTYNPGQNNRKCTRCPGGLTTVAPGASASIACVAPPGYYFYRGKAVACAQGFYKSTTANSDCTACPTGFTTAATTIATGVTACSILKAGFSAPPGAAGTAVGVACPANTYRTGDIKWDTNAANTGTSCTPCPTDCTTNNVVGASSAAMCITPPGYGWTGTSCSACLTGSYNAGYNREACTTCGTGITTDGTGTVSSDGCKILAGYGTARDASGVLSAAVCPLDTYGRDAATYGLVDVECTKCIDNTRTTRTGSTTAASCVTNIGYGYDDGAVNLCDYGFWSSGGTQAPCAYCGDGKNTSDLASPTSPATGATNATWCVTAAGWTTDFAGGIKPCVKGSFKSALGDAACTNCSTWGLTTSTPYGAIQREDCDACLPGFGNTGGAFASLSSASCTKCPSGTYSAGGAAGGAACDACPTSPDYTGTIVSRPGSVTSDSCVREFPTGDDSLTNDLEWDIIPIKDAYLSLDLTRKTIQTCQAGCKEDTRCQYFVFYSSVEGEASRCYLRLATAAVTKVTGDVTNPGSSFYIMYAVEGGQYVAYTANEGRHAATTGTTIATYTSFDLAKAACDASTGCIGFANTAADSWRTFSGANWPGAVGKIRVVGEAINSWLAY